jgi:hypothetical protein
MGTTQDGVQQKQPPSGIFTIAAIIASMSGVLIVIITNARSYLDPLAFNAVVLAFASAILALITYHFILVPLRPRISTWRRESEQESAAARTLPDLRDIVDRFVELVSTDYSTAINRPIQSFAQQQAVPGIKSPEVHLREQYLMQALSSTYYTAMASPIAQLQSDLKHSSKRGGSRLLLAHFAAEFFNLLQVHKLVYVDSYVRACKTVGISNVPYVSKEEYTKFLTKYNQFVSSYTEFSRRANRRIGERLFGEYLENAVPLEI